MKILKKRQRNVGSTAKRKEFKRRELNKRLLLLENALARIIAVAKDMNTYNWATPDQRCHIIAIAQEALKGG